MTDNHTRLDPRLDEIQARLARRDAMIDDGSYKISQTRCNDPERHGFHTRHPENVRVETSHHHSYISHLEALAEAVPYLLAELRKAHEAGQYALDIVAEGYPRHVGPFPTRADAERWMEGRKLTGSWNVYPMIRAAVAAAKGDGE